MKNYPLSVMAVALLSAPMAQAVEFDPIVVTATRSAQTADEALASVTVITRDDIERQQAQSVPALLRGVPGVNVVNNGGLGKATSVFMRGTESDHVLVLIDGIKVGSATLGSTAFEHIPVEQIERIEVVRGPRSSLYGSEAIGGVIQIFTRKGGGSFTPFFSVGGGTYGTYSASAGLSGGGERGWYSVNASTVDTDGFNACNGKPFPNGGGCFTVEPDKDGYQNVSASLRAGYRFDNGLEVDGHALRATGDTEFDGSFGNESETVQQVVGGSARYSPTNIWRVTLTAGRSRDESDISLEGDFQNLIDTERDTVSIQNDVAIRDNDLLTVGVDYHDDRATTTSFGDVSRDNAALFAQYQFAVAASDLQFSLRRDDNEQFGKRTTGGAAWGYALSQDLRLTVAYGTAFKAPTFNELYYPFFGNPEIRPEESRSVEIGLRGKTAWGGWSFNLYETRVDDLIAFDAATFLAANIEEARIRGAEATLAVQLEQWTLNTSFTLLNPDNLTDNANGGNVLPRRAQRSLRLDADRPLGKFNLGATFVAEGGRYDDLANTRRLGGYGTVDLRAEYLLAKAWRVQMRLDNALDKDYETAEFFNQPGRSLFVTLRYQG